MIRWRVRACAESGIPVPIVDPLDGMLRSRKGGTGGIGRKSCACTSGRAQFPAFVQDSLRRMFMALGTVHCPVPWSDAIPLNRYGSPR